jgi:hypothetical protein
MKTIEVYKSGKKKMKKKKELDWKIKLKTNKKLTKRLRIKITNQKIENWYLNIPN